MLENNVETFWYLKTEYYAFILAYETFENLSSRMRTEKEYETTIL